MFKDKKVLITGGLGFIGSNLAIRLVDEGAEVTIIDSMIPEYGGNMFNIDPVKDKVHINFSDMRDQHTMPYLVAGKDFIFNLAGQVSHLDSMQEPLVDLDINIRAQASLLEACRTSNPEAVIVYSSTRQFYGSPKYMPVDEQHPLNPPDVNGINKLAGEQYHLLYNKVHGLPISALRLTNTYGSRQLIKNSRQGFIGWFINRCVQGETIKLFGGGGQIRDFCYVDDVIDALLLCAVDKNCYGKVFNLSGEKSSLTDLAQLMISINKKGRIEEVPFPDDRKKIDIGNFFGTSELFRKVTGWTAKINLKEGLKRTFDYYNSWGRHYIEEER
ncbi:NAD-dependent epimerase/dehydratase family protein [Fibrobacterota bacterium]